MTTRDKVLYVKITDEEDEQINQAKTMFDGNKSAMARQCIKDAIQFREAGIYTRDIPRIKKLLGIE